MDKITPAIKSEFQNKDLFEKIKSGIFNDNNNYLLKKRSWYKYSKKRHILIKGKYINKTAYVITCGPSLSKVWDNNLKRFLADKLVIAVKQAQILCPEICDFHLYNEVRMQAYDYSEDTIRISCSKFQEKYPSHIHYPVNNYKYDESMFVTNDYERWDLENTYVRPWGVGIMFEIGLFLPIYLGCDRIVIIGFDMNRKGSYHFYDASNDADSQFYKVDDAEFGYAKRSISYYLFWAQSKKVKVGNYSPLSELPIPKIKNIHSWA